jgi:hypothetical protein
MVTRLRGGLGNQLFQIIGSKFYANQLSLPLILDDRDILFHHDKSRRSWSRHYNCKKLLANYAVSWRSKSEIIIAKVVSKVIDGKNDKHILLREKDLSALDGILPKGNVHVSDYFENKLYLVDNAINISRSIFKPKDHSKLSELEGIISQRQDLAVIHVRLGDFLLSRSTKIVPWNFYADAIQAYVQEGVRRFILFSDDLDTAEAFVEGILKKYKGVDILCPERKIELNPVELLWILSASSKFIASNSTLSWWAGAINVSGSITSPFGPNLQLDFWRQV